MRIICCLIFILALHPSGNAQNAVIDSLEQRFSAESDATKKLEILDQITDEAFSLNFDLALTYAKRGQALAETSENKTWLARFDETRGRTHANLGHLDSASFFFDKALEGYTALGDKKGQANVIFKQAWVFQRKGDFDEGMKFNLQGLKIMEELGDQKGIASALGRLSGDLYNQEKPTESLDYAKRAIAICREQGFENELPYNLYHAGYASIGLLENKEALAYFDEALALVHKYNFGMSPIADMSNGRGNALKKLERYPEAIEAYQITLTNAEQANYYGGIFTATANLGEVNMRLGNYADALPYQLRTIEMQEAGNHGNNLTENYGHASTIYENLGDYQNALLYQKKARRMRDSTASEASDAAMLELRTQYETEQKEATIALQEARIDQQRTVQWLSFGMIGLVGIFAFIFYRNANTRKKINALLFAKNAENELLLKEVHHRVKNNLEIVSSLLALQSAQIDDPGIKFAMQEGQNRVHSIGIVHQKLYQGENLGAVEMKDYFVNLGDNILDSFGADERVTIECAMNNLELDIDTAVPLGLIVNELLTNAMKYAFPDGRKGKIKIHLEKKDESTLSLKIADDGVGYSGTTQGTGFGSQLIVLLTKQLRGSMREESADGTAIYFDFKLRSAA